MGKARQEGERPLKLVITFFFNLTCSPDIILYTLRLKMVYMHTIHQKHNFKTFVRSVASV